jgi:Domain of unknown function (DUF397)
VGEVAGGGAPRARCRRRGAAACRSIRARGYSAGSAAVPEAGRPVEGRGDRCRQRDQDELGAFAAHPRYPVAVLLAGAGDVRTGGVEDPQTQPPGMAASAKSHGLTDSRATVSRASNSGCVNPQGRRSGGHRRGGVRARRRAYAPLNRHHAILHVHLNVHVNMHLQKPSATCRCICIERVRLQPPAVVASPRRRALNLILEPRRETMQVTNGIPADQLPTACWRKSRASNPSGSCVEIAELPGGAIAFRNSRYPSGPALVYTPAEIRAFLTGAKNGEFDDLLRQTAPTGAS